MILPYQIILTKAVNIALVPYCYNEQTQNIIDNVYKQFHDDCVRTIIVIIPSCNQSLYGVLLPYSCIETLECFLYSHNTEIMGHRLFSYAPYQFVHESFMCRHHRLSKQYGMNCCLLYLGSLSFYDAGLLATLLMNVVGEHEAFMICADFGQLEHVMHDNPCDESSLCKVYDLDTLLVKKIESYEKNYNFFMQSSQHRSSFLLLHRLLQCDQCNTLHSHFLLYGTSPEFLQECDKIISYQNSMITRYAGFIFDDHDDEIISLYEQSELLYCARNGLYDFFNITHLRKPCIISSAMQQPHGIFVSLYMMSDHGIVLRGTAGKALSSSPAFESIRELTMEAAYKDNRFRPLRYQDIDSTIINISMLTNVKKINSCEIINEYHGVMLYYQNIVALTFPSSLPVENWSYESILNNLSMQVSNNCQLWKSEKLEICTFKPLCFQED